MVRGLAVVCMSAALCGAVVPPSTETAPTSSEASARARTPTPHFLGQDHFDDIDDVAELRELESDVKSVIEKVRPAVVLLRTTGSSGRMTTGTGVIINSKGLVATCGHVGVGPGRNIEAVLSDGTVIQGKTLGQLVEGSLDCGLVQLDLEDRELPWRPMGTTVGLAKGDWVVAMGYTHGQPKEHRPALARVGRVLGNSDTELLFDAPIDSGDSGGPSFNLRGEVIGLNSRCGRQSWENVATPIDALSIRLKDLQPQTERGERQRGPRGRGPSTRFPSGTTDAGKLAVQRDVRLNAVAQRAQESLLRVLVGEDQVAYGTVVHARGLAVTKSSQVPEGETITAETSDGDQYSARVVARDIGADVALLLVKVPVEEELVPVKWSADRELVPGTALVTPRTFPDSPVLGFAAIETRESERDSTNTPYLGVRTEVPSREELDRAGVERAVLVGSVSEGMPAERVGILAGEMLLTLNGKRIEGREDLRRQLNKHRIGERVTVEVFGKEGKRSVDAVLSPSTDGSGRVRRGNTMTEISKLSSGFGEVVAHDGITRPEQMGGPVVDLDGRVVGLNIARYDRTATHALPASRMPEIVKDLTEQARKARESETAPAAK